MVLCDSNILIDFFKNQAETVNEIRQIVPRNVLLSEITIMELMVGARNRADLLDINKKLKFYARIGISKEVSNRAVELIEQFGLSHGLKIPDALIGSTALEHDLELFTYNLKDFVFLPGIKLYKPIY